jgi:flagellar biosynthesis protein FlhA
MKNRKYAPAAIPAAVVLIVVMLVVPAPPAVLDLLITVNITIAVLVLLLSMRVKRPLDFSVFPSLLLIATMFRLALNVSATRLVLLHGSAGRVIQSFGHFVVGGSVLVGLVVFMILVIIQFVVITNGSGRVAEVAARFTLDAMPGKQMAIDADLNTGAIDEETARRRRREVADEADFYGAMDGASKFVKGDAVAAMIITAVNLLGGLGVGILQRHETLSAAVSQYSLLSIGDGLVSQIPALLLSVSTGLIVTRAASDDEFGTDVLGQFTRQHGALRTAGIAVCLIGLMPGMPKLPFLTVGILTFVFGQQAKASNAAKALADATVTVMPPPLPDSTEALLAGGRVEALEIELAVDLVDLVDTSRGGDLLDRVKALRRKVATDLGIVIPPVRTRDNVDLPPSTYAVRLHEVEVGRGTAPAGRVLAVGTYLDQLPGDLTTEPVFGMPAKWVPLEFRQQAMASGCAVVDRSAVITTHLNEIVRQHAGSLLTRQRVKELLDIVKHTDSVVVEEITAAQLSLGELQAVLRGLLDEGVPIRDLVRIFEAVSLTARVSKDPDALIEAARSTIGQAIAGQYVVDGILPVITFEPALEHRLIDSLRPGDGGQAVVMETDMAERLFAEVGAVSRRIEDQGRRPVLVVSARLRPALRRLLHAAVPNLPVLSVNELNGQLRPERMGVVSLDLATV